MTPYAHERNPFLLMIDPDVVFAAIANSERLGQLNRHLCRPLDRQVGALPDGEPESASDEPEIVESELGVSGVSDEGR